MAEENKKTGFKISKKFIIIGGIILILAVVLSAVFIFFFTGTDKPEEKKDEQKEKPAEIQSVYKPGPEDFYPGLFNFREMTIKLKPEFEEEPPRNLRITIYAEVIEDSDKFILMEKKNTIEKYLVSYFNSKKPSDIDDLSEKLIIKQELFKKINEISGKKIMKNIYFTEFLILDW
ncbi:MAG: flagellar basal body-associated FliL family protein [Desulfobacteraceae bacterium]|nr:flagellar basal body-associated FliL family protein [Desulfobacteraceae bacterium]